MRISVASISTLLLALASLHGADSDPKTMTGAADAFRQLKTLAGEWQADTEMGKARVSYELIAGGTALVEHERSEKMPDMLTVYTLDGGLGFNLLGDGLRAAVDPVQRR